MDFKKVKYIAKYKYPGLGFPVVLYNVKVIPSKEYGNLYNIDLRKVSIMGGIELILKNKNPDGRQIKYIRQMLEYSSKKMAKTLNVSVESYVELEKIQGKSIELDPKKITKILKLLKGKLISELDDLLDIRIKLERTNLNKKDVFEIN